MNKKPIIALDAGHGIKTAGKRCMRSIDPAETREWWLNDRIADQVQALLAGYDCTVIRADDTMGVKDIPLASRVKTANSARADMYISIHHNAGIKGGTGGGTVVYYHSSAAVRPLQAQRLYDSVTARTGLFGNRSSKVIKNGFYVIKHTTMPALLIENGFMDSQVDTPIILTPAHATRTAQGIVDFLVSELQLSGSAQRPQTGGSNATGDNSSMGTFYPAYTGPKTTLWAAMMALGLGASYAHRKLIAKANNITGYIGTAAQNTQIYNLLVAGILKKE